FGAWIGTTRRAQEINGNYRDERVFNTTTVTRSIGDRTSGFHPKSLERDYSTYPPRGGKKPWIGLATNFDNTGPILSAHPGGAMVSFVDGSVRFLSEELDLNTFKLLAIRDSGQVK